MSAVNETLIRDIVADVMGRLNGSPAPARPAPAPSSTPAATSCGCGDKSSRPSGGSVSTGTGRGKYGVFQDANEACAAAHEGFLQLRQKGVEARVKVVEIVKTMAEANAAEW